MRIQLLRVSLLIFCLDCSCVLRTQAPPAASATTPAAHAPDPDNGVGNYAEGLFVPMIPGQPFRAKIEAQVTRRLPDGTTMALKYYALEARDDSGRVYREARDMIAADSSMESALMRTYVYDGKTSLISICTPSRQTCQQMPLQPPPEEEQLGPSKDGKSVLARESLGTKTMDGLQVIGTRETRTFNPGAFGNDKPVIVTKEFWYSPRLEFNLSVTRSDPRSGSQKLEVTDLKLGDPGSEWFAIPAGYRIVTERAMGPRPMAPELEPLIEKNVSGMSPDELRTALQPVEAAIGAYAKVHATASPNDNNEAFAGQLRMRLSNDLRMIQQMRIPPKTQLQEADLRLGQTFHEVVSSPCIDKPQPGDSPSLPTSAEGLRNEQTAWLALRDAWVGFLAKLFPESDPASLGWMFTNERDSELRRLQNAERNRGCIPEESIAPILVRYLTTFDADKLDAAVKPVDDAIRDYAKAHAEAEPGDQNENFVRMTQQQLASDLNMRQRNSAFPQYQFPGSDLRLNLVFRGIISSPCLTKSIPGDPPNAPVNADKLRAEEDAWVAMRNAWTTFLASVFPGASQASLGAMLTQQRTFQLQQIQNIERNRGCTEEESIEPLLAQFVVNMNADQLDAAAKPVDAAIRAYGAAHADAEPGDQNNDFVRMVEQQLSFELSTLQHSPTPTKDEFEKADLALNQAYRAVISSPCLSKPAPGDPPNAPVSAEKLRAEERAWVALRDAWTTFMTAAFPNNGDQAAFATMLTQQRTTELLQIQNVERNRGCAPAE